MMNVGIREIWPPFPKTPAGYRTVCIPKSQKWIVDKLRKLNPFGTFAFMDSKGERLNTDKIQKRLTYICNKAGISPRSPHKIRKIYGSILLDNNMDRKLVEGQMVDTTIDVTERFYHRNRHKREEKQAAFDALPEFRVV